MPYKAVVAFFLYTVLLDAFVSPFPVNQESTFSTAGHRKEKGRSLPVVISHYSNVRSSKNQEGAGATALTPLEATVHSNADDEQPAEGLHPSDAAKIDENPNLAPSILPKSPEGDLENTAPDKIQGDVNSKSKPEEETKDPVTSDIQEPAAPVAVDISQLPTNLDVASSSARMGDLVDGGKKGVSESELDEENKPEQKEQHSQVSDSLLTHLKEQEEVAEEKEGDKKQVALSHEMTMLSDSKGDKPVHINSEEKMETAPVADIGIHVDANADENASQNIKEPKRDQTDHVATAAIEPQPISIGKNEDEIKEIGKESPRLAGKISVESPLDLAGAPDFSNQEKKNNEREESTKPVSSDEETKPLHVEGLEVINMPAAETDDHEAFQIHDSKSGMTKNKQQVKKGEDKKSASSLQSINMNSDGIISDKSKSSSFVATNLPLEDFFEEDRSFKGGLEELHPSLFEGRSDHLTATASKVENLDLIATSKEVEDESDSIRLERDDKKNEETKKDFIVKEKEKDPKLAEKEKFFGKPVKEGKPLKQSKPAVILVSDDPVLEYDLSSKENGKRSQVQSDSEGQNDKKTSKVQLVYDFPTQYHILLNFFYYFRLKMEWNSSYNITINII